MKQQKLKILFFLPLRCIKIHFSNGKVFVHHVFGNHPFYSTTWWCTSVYPARNHNLLTTSFSVPHTFVEKYVHYTKAARKQHHQPKKYTSSFSISLCVELLANQKEEDVQPPSCSPNRWRVFIAYNRSYFLTFPCLLNHH